MPFGVTRPRTVTAAGAAAPDRFPAEKKWKQPPPGVTPEKNTTGTGTWIERWKSPTTDEWVYNYTLAEMQRRAGIKFLENQRFGKKLPALRAQLEKDLTAGGKKQVVALAVKLIDKAYIRVGNEDSAEEGHFGASTLLNKHVTVRGDTVHLRFVGKSGVDLKLEVKDASLARAMAAQARTLTSPEQEFFQFEGCDVTAEDVNAYLKPFDATAKKFRTYHATRLAREGLLAAGDVPEKDRERTVTRVIEQVAAQLGHTPAVCRSNYVDPMVVKAFLVGELE